MSQTGSGRLIISSASGPEYNMACDEALGLCVELPVLRFYMWEPPAVSLGYFQTPGEVAPFTDNIGHTPFVKRITGGGAIYHFEELTYSITAKPGALGLPDSTAGSYRFLHRPFIKVFREMGIKAENKDIGTGSRKAVCFDSVTPYDVSVGSRKLMGSAQRRHRRFFLQHGSIPLLPNPLSEMSTSLQQETGKEHDPEQLALRICTYMGELLGIHFKLSEINTAEKRKIDKLIPKYKECNSAGVT